MIRQIVSTASNCARVSKTGTQPWSPMLIRSVSTWTNHNQNHAEWNQSHHMSLMGFVGVTAALVSCNSMENKYVQCEEAPSDSPTTVSTHDDKETMPTTTTTCTTSPNPLWPSGVSDEMVNDYVNEILDNPDINISSIPDSLERLIYMSTVRLTLNALYSGLSMFHGTQLMGHVLELVRVDSNVKLNLHHSSKTIDSQQLDKLALELLQNKAVNQGWLPDVVEKQVYANCLKLIFSLLETVSDTLSMRMCGHELSLSFEPLQSMETLAETQESHLELKDEILEELVTQCIQESQDAFVGNATLASYLPFYKGFVRNLHKTLYCLMLGIMSDMLAKTELAVLEDRVKLRLVPMDIDVWRAMRASGETKAQENQMDQIAELEKQLEEAHDAEARARKLAGIGLLTAIMTTTVAAILHLD